VNRDRSVVDGGHQGRESRATGMVPIFVPPTVFGEMEAILDSPVVSDMAKNVRCTNAVWIEAGDEVACIVQHDFSIAGFQLSIDTHSDFTVGQLKRFSDVVGVV
jgi:hypothetical protein